MKGMLAEIEPAMIKLFKRAAPDMPSLRPPPQASMPPVQPDYVRMVGASTGDDADESSLAEIRVDLSGGGDSSAAADGIDVSGRSPRQGAQVPEWMNESRSANVYDSIQIPSIGGVDWSDSDEDDDGVGNGKRWNKNDSPKTKVFTREQIKAMAERRYKQHLRAEGLEDGDEA